MSNNVMIDSSVLIEYIKGRKRKLLVELIGDTNVNCFVNETVVSEYLYHFLAIYGGKSPMAVQKSRFINAIIASSFDYTFIDRFSFLSTDVSIIASVPELMSKYNLLPNDAIILATCKIHAITQLASHDTDFEAACKAEGITLLTEKN